MISLQRSMHSSQMYTPGPAMSFLTCFWDFPQKEHLSSSPPSPNLATSLDPQVLEGGRDRAAIVGELPSGDHLVDHAVLLGLFGGHHEIPIRVLVQLLDRLSGVLREDLFEQITHTHDLPGLDLYVSRLAGAAPPRLVQEDPSVR